MKDIKMLLDDYREMICLYFQRIKRLFIVLLEDYWGLIVIIMVVIN